jgi:ATP-binding cassette, subfamily B, bacterial
VTHCLRLDLAFHTSRAPGAIIERVDGDVNALAVFFSRAIVQVLGNLLLLAGVLVMVFLEDVRAGLAVAAFAALALVVLARVRAVAVPHWTGVRGESARFFGFLGEALAGTEDLRANGATAYPLRRFHEVLRSWRPRQMRAWMAEGGIWCSTLVVFGAGTALAFIAGALLYNAGAISLGGVFLLFQYTGMLRQPIEQIRTQLQEMQKAAAGAARVSDLLAERATVAEPHDPRPLPRGLLASVFGRVSFGDGWPDPVLRDVSFDLPAGRVLAIVGRTGSGKSTIARLLARLYDPVRGVVRLGGVPLHETALTDVRHRIAVVTQEVQLFEASLRDNVTFFDGEADDARVLGALEALGLGGWLRSLPAGLDTPLGPGGGGLSAGEAQLVAFARAFLADPGLVILDEASSRLDPATERLIERAVDRLLAGRTGVIIAHRLDTVARADDVLVMDGGRVAEFGVRTRLALDPRARFHALLRAALETEEAEVPA